METAAFDKMILKYFVTKILPYVPDLVYASESLG